MSDLEFSKELKSYETPIDGLVVYDLTVHGDSRGWFKENWQREKMTALDLPDFGPVQNNVSFNEKKGVTRGLHAEPWDKFVTIGTGSVFGAWCDIREGSPTYGKSFTVELDPTKGIFVPRGVANGFQTLQDETVYMYLVNDHWSPDGEYAFVNVADESLGIDWPIPLNEAELSEKDKNHPILKDALTIKPKKTLITGANGQLGKALQIEFPNAEFVSRQDLDITGNITTARRWKDYGVVINAAAYTAVDTAETKEGREAAWRTNALAPALLARVAKENDITLVNISTDYVFDGTNNIHDESEFLTPLGVYGQSKAAGDYAVTSALEKEYTVRTTWVIGDGKNFVLTMKSLAERDIKPNVVDDQIGRLTFTQDLSKAIKHLIDTKAPYGIYNVSNEGEAVSWADIAREVYELSGKSRDDITPVSTEQYYAGKEDIAPRPLQSTLNLAKIEATGFTPREWKQALREYLENQ
ncbi:MAG: dTDP-4-dehydrorhamnose reductase [Candidatus Saccharibacteria bacterium]|nr:dTDP-4-dehydrorhamnose reductase [Candidatus Saccharibacteria bacterium]